MNKKIVLLFTVLAFQTLFLVGLFSDLFLTKHDVELNYQEIQETCLKNKNTYCKYSINIKDLDKDELKKNRKIKNIC